MGILSRRSTPSITREQMMNGKPIRNEELIVERSEDGEVTLKRARRNVWWLNMLAKVSRLPEYQTLTLDRVGSSVWDWCDGKNSIGDVIAMLAKEHKLSRKEAEVSMLAYLKQLAQRGVIAVVIDPDGVGEAEGQADDAEESGGRTVL
jgi:hypothetical protein